MTKLRIVDMSTKQVCSYQGTVLVFNADEEERAENILWLVQRQSGEGGPYRLERFDDSD